MYFPAGSRCTWVGTWNAIGWFNAPTTHVVDATSYLEANANMAVESSAISEPDVLSTSSTRTVTLSIRTLIDRNDLQDIDLDCRHAFYKTIQQEPDSSDITDYALADDAGNTSAPQKTGAPTTVTKTPDQTGDWWSRLKDQFTGAGVGLIIGAGAVIALVIVVAVKE